MKRVEKLAKIIKVIEAVVEDVERDAKDFDGQPFTGKTMAIYMGNHGAAIAAVADAIKELATLTATLKELEGE